MENIICVKNLKKSYGSLEAVKGIDFEVKAGQLFAFLGPNGAGKSTTINILSTLLQSSDGRVFINGYDINQQADKIRQQIGVVFQDSVLDALLSVRENLQTRASFYFNKKEQIEQAIEKVCKITDIKDIINRPYGKLSGGQRRRVDIARALLNTPSILFLDEPTTGLDPQTRKNVWQTILKLQKESNMTIFLTTHYMEETAFADNVVIIDHGQIVAEGSPAQLKERFCNDILRFSATDEKGMESLLKGFCAYEKNGSSYKVKLKDTKTAINILNHIKPFLDSFEVIQGTMDDVFISITSKEEIK